MNKLTKYGDKNSLISIKYFILNSKHFIAVVIQSTKYFWACYEDQLVMQNRVNSYHL